MSGTNRDLENRKFIVRDNDDNPWGPFDDPKAAAKWAAEKWPNIPQYDPDNYDGHGCWVVEPLRDPD